MDVKLSDKVLKKLKKTPKHIGTKLLAWSNLVRIQGLQYTQLIKGFHDEPLKGAKSNRRSIRLSKKWRAEYTVNVDGVVEFILVEEVHPHDY